MDTSIGRVRVTNKNDFDIIDRYDGVPFTFEQNRPETIPVDAANHIFGWRPVDVDDPNDSAMRVAADMLLYCQKRHGWNTPEVIKAGEHMKRFNALTFEAVRFKLVEVKEDDEPEELPNPLTSVTIAQGGGGGGAGKGTRRGA